MFNKITYESYEVRSDIFGKFGRTFMSKDEAEKYIDELNTFLVEKGCTPFNWYIVYNTCVVITDYNGNLISEVQSSVRV